MNTLNEVGGDIRNAGTYRLVSSWWDTIHKWTSENIPGVHDSLADGASDLTFQVVSAFY